MTNIPQGRGNKNNKIATNQGRQTEENEDKFVPTADAIKQRNQAAIRQERT
jgi:hypothetical protein